jgi:hypothetical protein
MTQSSTVCFLPVLHHSFSELPFSKLSRLREAPTVRLSAIARGCRWLDEIVSGSVIGVEQMHPPKMQYASGQYDDFARVPRSKVASPAALR